jgi:polysaccharide export outer membrane protein
MPRCILRSAVGTLLMGLWVAGGCATPPAPVASPDVPQTAAPAILPPVASASWSEREPPYRLFPGDQLRVTPISAPELSTTTPVLPDGRISLPMAGAVMVADRTLAEARAEIEAAYRSLLRRPQVDLQIISVSPIEVYVGGAVKRPGPVALAGDLDILQAVILAGGLTPDAALDRVLVLRRDGEGGRVSAEINLDGAIHNRGNFDAVPLRRFDVILVPGTTGRDMGGARSGMPPR